MRWIASTNTPLSQAARPLLETSEAVSVAISTMTTAPGPELQVHRRGADGVAGEDSIESSKRVLEPIERVSEVLFGLIMVLTFTGSHLSAAASAAGAARAVAIPFLMIADPVRALRFSNAIAMLFLTGYVFGRAVGRGPWAMGASMVLLGSVLVGLTIALGG